MIIKYNKVCWWNTSNDVRLLNVCVQMICDDEMYLFKWCMIIKYNDVWWWNASNDVRLLNVCVQMMCDDEIQWCMMMTYNDAWWLNNEIWWCYICDTSNDVSQ